MINSNCRSWSDTGLLDVVHERVALLNQPLPSEIAISEHFGFRVVQPREIEGIDKVKGDRPD